MIVIISYEVENFLFSRETLFKFSFWYFDQKMRNIVTVSFSMKGQRTIISTGT